MDIINTVANYLSGVIGEFLGFLGIAFVYIGTGVADLFNERKKEWQHYFWFLPGIYFIFLSFYSLVHGTVLVVDAGKVLAYLGIGTGLVCTAWMINADRKTYLFKRVVSWVIMVLGIISVLCAAVLVIAPGLVPLTTLGGVVLIAIVTFTIWAFWYKYFNFKFKR